MQKRNGKRGKERKLVIFKINYKSKVKVEYNK